MKIIKWLWPRLNPMTRDEIIISHITPDLAKQWLKRKPLHDAMLFLSEAVRDTSCGYKHIHRNPTKPSREICLDCGDRHTDEPDTSFGLVVPGPGKEA